jgi:hypothetical protein
VQYAAPKPINRPDHQDIEPSPYRVLEHRVERGSLIPAFRALACEVIPARVMVLIP